MATVNKNFKVKHGLVVEGSTATVNGNQVLSEDASDQYILNLIGGETLVKSVSNEFDVSVGGELSIDRAVVDAYYDAAGAAAAAQTAAEGFATQAIANLVDGAPALLDTLNELAAALGDDENFASSIATSIGEKQDTLTAGSNIDITSDVISVTGLDTDDVAEGTNLYFTNQRAIDAVGGSATSENTPDTVVKRDSFGNFAAGEITASLQGNVTGDVTGTVSDISNHNTDGLLEGSANLYFTDQRALDATSEAYDVVGAAAAAQTAAELTASNALTTAVNDLEAYADQAELDAVSTANSYTDGEITTALSTAQGYADTAQSNAEGFATQAIANLVDSAPETLDTLNELAAALQDNPDIISDLQDIAAGKQDTLTAGSNIDITSDVISVTGLDTDDVAEGTNLYFTNQRALDATAAAYDAAGTAQGIVDALDTDDIEEGLTNLYFTDVRAVDALEAVVPNFTAVELNSVAKQVAATTGNIATASTVTAYAFAKAEYRSAKFLVKTAYSTHTEVSEVLLTLDTSDNIAITEYAIVGTNGSSMTVSADISGTDVRLRVTTINNNSTVTVMGTLIA
jgi:hypothetical protein